MHYKQIIDELLVPEEKLASVKDTLYTLCEILEIRDKAKNGNTLTAKDVEKVLHRSVYSLNYFPFWQVHGTTLRPLLFQAFEKSNSIEFFLPEAIAMSLIIAMPHRQEDYSEIKQLVINKLKS